METPQKTGRRKGGQKAHNSTRPNAIKHLDPKEGESKTPETMKVNGQVWSSIRHTMATNTISDCCIQHPCRRGSHPMGCSGTSARTGPHLGRHDGTIGVQSNMEQESSKAGSIYFDHDVYDQARGDAADVGPRGVGQHHDW